MSTSQISYNGTEISPVAETAPVSVAYNSATIATLNDGDTKTLGCHGKVMSSDVVVGGKTLNCNGKLMQGDIVVELAGSTPSGKTWYFNDTIGYPDTDMLNVNFTSNGAAYTGIQRQHMSGFWVMDLLNYLSIGTGKKVVVYNYLDDKWENEAYRTIVLDEHETGDVLAFLAANATKLS